VCVFVCVFVCVYTHTHTHIYIYIYKTYAIHKNLYAVILPFVWK